MTIRHTAISLGVCAGLLLTAAGCGGSEDASRAACDDFDVAFSDYSSGLVDAKTPEAAREVYSTLADSLDEIAATEGITTELDEQLQDGAELARRKTKTAEPGLDIPTDKMLRATTEICADIKS